MSAGTHSTAAGQLVRHSRFNTVCHTNSHPLRHLYIKKLARNRRRNENNSTFPRHRRPGALDCVSSLEKHRHYNWRLFTVYLLLLQSVALSSHKHCHGDVCIHSHVDSWQARARTQPHTRMHMAPWRQVTYKLHNCYEMTVQSSRISGEQVYECKQLH